MPTSPTPRLARLSIIVAFIVGLAGTLGVVAVRYGDGTAYLSDDPTACIQCHVMQDQFRSWVKSSHHEVATCNGCHVPEGPIMKWVSKADNGFFHSWAFTFRNHPDPIRIKPRNRAIAEANCVGCHEDLTHAIRTGESSGEELSCLHCHKDAGHAAFR